MGGTGVGSLFRRGWLAREPRALVVIAPGQADHSGRYEHVGTWLARRGFAVHAYDHRGHGRSSGRRGHVDRFDPLVDDLERVLRQVRAEHPALPLFVLGHGMGGLVAAALARERQPAVAGLAIAGAALSAPDRPRFRVGASRVLRRVAPRLSLGSGIDPVNLSSDPQVVAAYLADPLVERRMTVSLAVELRDAIGHTAPGGGDVSAPLLALHGGDDRICPPEGSERFASAAPRGRFVRYPGLRHEILNEPSRQSVLGDLEAWLSERLTAPEVATG